MAKKKKQTEPSTQETKESDYQEFTRHRWKNHTRWIALIGLVITDFVFIGSFIDHQMAATQPFSATVAFRALVVIVLMVLCNLSIIPSIVMEIDKIIVTKDVIAFQNLLFRLHEEWPNLTRMIDKPYLKFSVIKGKKFWYLINKGDIDNFDELAKTIERKAVNLVK